MRLLYIVGWGYVAIASTLLYRARQPEPGHALGAAVLSGSPAQRWFQQVKARCNTLEAELTMAQSPPPAGWDGTGFGAACWALAGRIRRAEGLIDALPEADRRNAAGIVFDVGHPVADAGDDDSAGPMMSLVVRYWPDHYMALYHAGIAQHRLGNHELARTHLSDFLRYYDVQDGWRGSAEAVLAEIDAGGDE